MKWREIDANSPNVAGSIQVRLPVSQSLLDKLDIVMSGHFAAVVLEALEDKSALILIEELGVLWETVHAVECIAPNEDGKDSFKRENPTRSRGMPVSSGGS